MRESADPDDDDYLLRDLDHTIFRLRVGPTLGVRPAPGSREDAVVTYVRDHPGSTLRTLWDSVPGLRARPYPEISRLVVNLVDDQTLQRAGKAPLEDVDDRYERVAACAVCGDPAATHPVVFWKFNTPVVRCPNCGLLYANPRWKAAHLFGRYTPDYWARYAAEVRATARDPARQAWWRSCLRVLAAGQAPGRLLDIGCATGEFLTLAREAGWAVSGLETAPEAAAAARAGGLPVHTGPLAAAPWEPGSFDAVTLWDVIEHLQDPRAALTQVARLLRPGGILLLTTPNIRSLSYAALGYHWNVVGPNDHLYYFAPRTLARLLHETGFAIHRMETTLPGVEVWHRWLYFPLFQRAAPLVHTLSRPLVARLLLGDEILVFARNL